MKKYRKLAVAIAGVASIALADFMDVKLQFGPEQLIDMGIALATSFGVFAVPNAK